MAVESLVQIQTEWVITTRGSAAITGTGRVQIYDSTPVVAPFFQGSYIVGSLTLATTQFILQYKRLTLITATRITLLADSQVVITNFGEIGRLTLAGSGG